jgi:hypothetical protein
MSILIVSHKDNLETQFLIRGLQTIIPDFECRFLTLLDALENLSFSNPHHRILIYAGPINDTINYDRFLREAQLFSGPIIAYGIWVGTKDVLTQKNLDIFDHIYVEFRELLYGLQQRIGTLYVHWAPHVAFLTPVDSTRNSLYEEDPISETRLVPRKRVKPNGSGRSTFASSLCDLGTGVEDPMSAKLRCHTSKLLGAGRDRPKVLVFLSRLEAHQRFKCHPISGTASPDIEDLYLVTYIETLRGSSLETLLDQIKQHDYCICTTYISHILAWITNRPFISYSNTDKVKFLLQDLDLCCPSLSSIELEPPLCVMIRLRVTHDPMEMIGIPDSVISKLQWLSLNQHLIQDHLKILHLKYQNHLQQSTIHNLLNWITKRCVPIPQIVYPDLESIYAMTRKYMINKLQYDPEFPVGLLHSEHAFIIADLACTKITGIPGSKYLSRFINVLVEHPNQLRNLIYKIAELHSKQLRYPKININYIDQGGFNGMHRWGWEGVLGLLQQFSTPYGALFDTFLDRTFCWCHPTYKEMGAVPYEMPWGGVLHHPFEDSYTGHSAVTMFQNPDFITSLHTCRVIVCLTEYLARQCRERLTQLGFKDIPVISILHPTEVPTLVFNPQSYFTDSNQRILQIGAWYRNTFSIYITPTPAGYKKCALIGMKMENYYPTEKIVLSRSLIDRYSPLFTDSNTYRVSVTNRWLMFCCQYIQSRNFLVDEFQMTIDDVPSQFVITINGRCNVEDSSSTTVSSLEGKYLLALRRWLQDRINSVTVYSCLNDTEYDKIVSQSVVFLDLIDCSASNTIIECIARQTPILIRRLDPVIEYIGEEYPLYFTNLEQIPQLLTVQNIYNASAYLRDRIPLIRTDTFVNRFRTQVLPCFDSAQDRRSFEG